ncbi:MAG: CRISPR-associated helicase Cas3' [Acidobacteriota bacterium]
MNELPPSTERPIDLIRFWAKTTHDAVKHPNAYHPLICHMIDVACVAEAMWNKVLPEVTKARLARPFGLENDLAKAGTLISFLAGLHDLGKCSPPFQLRGKQKSDSDQTRRLFDLYKATECDCDSFKAASDVPHGYVTAIALPDIMVEKYEFPRPLAKNVGEIIGGHHGTFATSTNFQNIKSFKNAEALGNEAWDRARDELVEALSDVLDVSISGKIAQKDKIENSTAMILAGFVSVADWIGSNTDYFPCEIADSTHLDEIDLKAYAERSSQNAERALTELGWKKWPKNPIEKSFESLFPKIENKRDLQLKAIEIAKEINGPGIFIVEALMGEGKTETAMYLADYFNAAIGTRGIYFALPTQATSNQMFGRVAEFLKNRFEESDEFVNLLLQHGHASLSDEFADDIKRFRSIKNTYADDSLSKNASVAAAEWFTYKKRGLLAPFGVGTIDQILLAALQTKHVFVRLFGLAHKVVIIDEVHAYDAYMSTLLERLLEWLAALGSPVIILSATLPKARRDVLIGAYLKGLGQSVAEGDRPSAVGETDSYPRISYAASGMPEKSFRVKRLETARENIRTLKIGWKADESFIDELKSLLEGGGCVAIICNTVRRAQTVYEQLTSDPFFVGPASDGKPKLDLLHARYRFIDRQQREKRALVRYGKEGSKVLITEDGKKAEHVVKRPDLAILVSTQIIEQSLDLDFDLMISDLAPADLLLQRSGRLQRHKRGDRPAVFRDAEGNEIPSFWILLPQLDETDEIKTFADGRQKGLPDFGDSGLVYDTHILLRTWLALREKTMISVPYEVEELIEMIYSSERIFADASQSNQDLLFLTKTEYEKALGEEKDQAKSRYISHPYFLGTLGNLLGVPKEEDAPDLHPHSQAMTRLVEPTAQVACLWQKDGRLYADERYSAEVSLETLPARSWEKEIVMNSISVSSRSVVHQLLNEPVPEGWKKSPLLRRHRVLSFDADRKCERFGYVFELDAEMGLLIYKKENQ